MSDTNKAFTPPLSNVLFAGLAATFDITPTKGSPNTRTSVLQGKRAKESTMSEIVEDIIEQLCRAELIDVPCAPVNLADIKGWLHQSALLWDALVGEAAFQTAPVAHLAFAPRAFARVVTIDASIRLAGLRDAAGLPPLERWFVAETPAQFLRDEIEKRRLTHDEASALIGVDRGTFEKWFLPRRILEPGSRRLVANFLAPRPDDERESETAARRSWRMRLNRHYAAWRLTVLLEDLFDKDFALELQEALVRLTNVFMYCLEYGRERTAKEHGVVLTREERANYGLAVALEGRNFSLLDAAGRPHEGYGAEARNWRSVAASREPLMSRWTPALRADNDLRFIEMHAGILGGVLEMRRRWEDDLRAHGVDPTLGKAKEMLDDAFSPSRALLWDPPVENLIPLGDGPGGMHTNPALMLATAAASEAALRGDSEFALKARAAAVCAAPHDAMAVFQFAAALGDVGRLLEAVDMARFAIALDPNLIAARLELAARLIECGRPFQARCELEGALARAGDRAPADLWFHLGIAHLRTGGAATALDMLKRALALNPRDSRALAAASEAAELSGDHDGAVSYAKDARHWGLKVPIPSRDR